MQEFSLSSVEKLKEMIQTLNIIRDQSNDPKYGDAVPYCNHASLTLILEKLANKCFEKTHFIRADINTSFKVEVDPVFDKDQLNLFLKRARKLQPIMMANYGSYPNFHFGP